MVFAREGVVLTPHCKNIGNLYGSEFWTYTLPKRVGWERGELRNQSFYPAFTTIMGPLGGMVFELGLLDGVFGKSPEEFLNKLREFVLSFVNSKDFESFIKSKREERL